MSERCPNCKIIDSSWHNGFSKSGPKIRHCRECGTQWQEDYPEGAKVPRRSQHIVSPVTRDEDAESLRTLAKWFDKEDLEGRFGRFPSGEVQRDLRRIADRLDQAKERG